MVLGVTIGVIVSTAAVADEPVRATGCGRHGRVLVIRGLFNVFSLGVDDLACQLSQLGYQVDVTPPSLADTVALHIEHEYLRDPSIGPLVIIGHSMGGRKCCEIPWTWRDADIPVKLVVILDSNPEIRVPDNVERCVNLYVTNDLGIFHGRAVVPDQSGTELVNVDVTKVPRPPGVPSVNHFNIDDSRWIHAMVVAEVERTLGPHSLARHVPTGDAALSPTPPDLSGDGTSLMPLSRPSPEAVSRALQLRIDAMRMSRGTNRPVRIQ
jgi:hypothetical protein